MPQVTTLIQGYRSIVGPDVTGSIVGVAEDGNMEGINVEGATLEDGRTEGSIDGAIVEVGSMDGCSAGSIEGK